jgi:isoleucyl-tRNA synthetase
VTKALEEARQQGIIGHSLDARVRLVPGDGLRSLLAERSDDLPALLIVSQVELADGAAGEDLGVSVERARGVKCERCWNYKEDVGRSEAHPGLCARCVQAVEATARD